MIYPGVQEVNQYKGVTIIERVAHSIEGNFVVLYYGIDTKEFPRYIGFSQREIVTMIDHDINNE